MYSLYIGSLPSTIKKHQLLAFFKSLNLKDLKVKKKTPKFDEKRFTVITTKSKKDYDFLLSAELTLNEHRLKIEPYLTGKRKRVKDRELKNRRIYVGGLFQSMTDHKLRTTFEQYGKVESAYLSKKTRGKKFGFGFVTFADPEVARRLILKRKLKIGGLAFRIKGFGEEYREKKQAVEKDKNQDQEGQENSQTAQDASQGEGHSSTGSESLMNKKKHASQASSSGLVHRQSDGTGEQEHSSPAIRTPGSRPEEPHHLAGPRGRAANNKASSLTALFSDMQERKSRALMTGLRGCKFLYNHGPLNLGFRW